MRIFLYISAIVLANIITAKIMPINLGLFIVPTGSLLIGLTFVFRDLVQNQYGRKNTYLIILAALGISAISSGLLGDTLWIVFASALSFLISEATDTEIYTRLKKSFLKRVAWSGVISGVLDSSVFVIVGLSPIGAGFLSWELVPYAILGQILTKTLMVGCGVMGIKLLKVDSKLFKTV